MVKDGYKMTEVGEIPVEWELVKFSKFMSQIRGGASLKPSDFLSSGVPVLPKSGVGWGGVLTIEKKNQQYVSRAYASRFERNCVDSKFTIIVLRDLVPSGPNIGLCVRIIDHQTYVLAQGVYGLILDSSIIESSYLIQYSNSNEYRKLMQSILVGSTQVHIRNTTLKNTSLPLPPTLAEQTAIATALSDADGLIRSLEAVIAKKRAIKEGVMGELLRPKEGWVETTLGKVAAVTGGGTPRTSVQEFWGGEIEWFTPTEVGKTKYLLTSRRKITESGFANCGAQMLPVGTVLLTSRAGIGDLGILTKTACTNQGFQSLIAHEETDAEFLYYLMGTLKSKLLEKASGSTFLEISPNNVRAIDVIIPIDKKEQTAIAEVLSNIDAELTTLTIKLSKARQLKAGMMGDLLTGKVRLV